MTLRAHARCFLYAAGITVVVTAVSCLIVGYVGAIVWAMIEYGFLAGLLVMIVPASFVGAALTCYEQRNYPNGKRTEHTGVR